jgi:hypothetical protein
VTICILYLWLQQGYAKFPTTSSEIRVVVALVAVGFLLTVCLMRPMLEAVQFLERRKTPRGNRGRQLVERLAVTHPLALRGRDLRGADLAGAFLVNTDLSDTDLRGVDLTGADLDGACLRDAIYDAQTRWPEGFEPQRFGAVCVGREVRGEEQATSAEERR